MVSETTGIGRKAGSSLLHSVRTADAIGRSLNTYVTINFWELGSTSETIFWDFAKLRSEWFLRWSRYAPRKAGSKNGIPTWTYVHEAPEGRAHTHWMVHISPDNRERFETALMKQLTKQFGQNIPQGAVHVQDVYNGEGLKLYLAKGLQDIWAELWEIEHEDMGTITHRRADTSRNLGPSVRAPLIADYKSRKWRKAA